MVSPLTDFTIHAGEPVWLALMQQSQAASALSDHHKYKVGSALASIRKGEDPVFRSSANVIPDAFKKSGFTTFDTIAGHHLTEHGEFILLKDSQPADLTLMACNICFCPTCTNLAIVHGVDALYYDVRVFDDPYLGERFEKGWFELSVPIARAAGMPIYAVDLEKKERIEIVKGLPKHQRPQLPPLLLDEALTEEDLQNDIILPERYAAVTVARHKITGAPYLLGAEETIPPGLSEEDHDKLHLSYENHRYKPGICPIMRLTMEAAKRNLTLRGAEIFCNFLPRAARQIDLVACGVSQIHVPESRYRKGLSCDTEAYEALVSLAQKKFIRYSVYKDEEPAPMFTLGL